MAGAKWIKITTDLFDDEKILLIESLPEADSIIVIWFKLLCLAGKQNNSGVFMFSNQMPFTEKMLATIFRRKESTINLALQTFEKFGMVEIVDDLITIPNWGKHQSLDQLEHKKKYMRTYMQDYREKQKTIACKTNSKANCKTNSKTNVSEADRERDKEENIERDKEREGEKETPSPLHLGIYNNVILSEEELAALKKDYPSEYDKMIDNLSMYMKSSGKLYKDHYATIRKWKREDAEKETQSTKRTTNRFLDYTFKRMTPEENKELVDKLMKKNERPKDSATMEDRLLRYKGGKNET